MADALHDRLTPTPEMLALAREIVAKIHFGEGWRRADAVLSGKLDDSQHVQIALAAIIATTERAPTWSRMREALRFYANPDNWLGSMFLPASPARVDRGDLARAALTLDGRA